MFSILGKLNIGHVVVLGYFIIRFKSWYGFKLLFYLCAISDTDSIDASILYISIISNNHSLKHNLKKILTLLFSPRPSLKRNAALRRLPETT